MVIDPALRQLLWMRFRGGIGHRLSQMMSLRGFMFAMIMGGIVVFLIRAGANDPTGELGAALSDEQAGVRYYISTFMPLGLASACLFTIFVSTGPAFYFSQNEINFLFTGPFSRRSLLIYKFCAYLAGAVVSATILTLLIPPRASSGLAAFLGTLLTLLFIQLSSAAVRVIALASDARWIKFARSPTTIISLAVTGIAIFFWLSTTQINIIDLLAAVRHSAIGSFLLAPFAVFSEVFLATNMFPDLIGWAVLAIAMNALLLDHRPGARWPHPPTGL